MGLPLKEITKQVGGLKSYGVKMIKLAELARKLGFKVTCYSYNKKKAKRKAKIKKPDKRNIIRFLKKEVPVILAVKTYLLDDSRPRDFGHFIVINGYKNKVYTYIDSRDLKNHKIKEKYLLFAWYSNVLKSSGYLLAIEKK
ncbi:MAG: hypothetical protein U5L76_03035 [Patescibacteria group bacterium]|nr:hypothetical protein [Patescibacteria group bacterium]